MGRCKCYPCTGTRYRHLQYLIPEIFFHLRVIGACLVTTEYIMAMSLCEKSDNNICI